MLIQMLRRGVVLALAALLLGCATGAVHKFYDGAARSPSDLATIQPWLEKSFSSMSVLNAWPVSIDGRPTEPYQGPLPSYLVLPGEHRVVIGFNWNDIGKKTQMGGEDPVPLTFTAKAGRTYITKASMPVFVGKDRPVISFWIEDAASGEVVAGTRLPGPPGAR